MKETLILTKHDFEKLVCEYCPKDMRLTQAQSKAVVRAVVSAITDAVDRGESVTLYRFGTFEPYDRPPMNRRHPETRKMITCPAKKMLRFHPTDWLLDYLNEEDQSEEA